MKPKHLTENMTLRLDPRLNDAVTEAAYDHRLTKAAFIRATLQQAIRARLTRNAMKNGARQA